MIGLTPKMRELLAYLSERDECPSFDEMRKAIGAGSKASVFRLLNGLEERGHIRRQRFMERAIEVVRPRPSLLKLPPCLFVTNDMMLFDRDWSVLAVVFTPADCEQIADNNRAAFAAEQRAA